MVGFVKAIQKFQKLEILIRKPSTGRFPEENDAKT
jgi:hypothetical protein